MTEVCANVERVLSALSIGPMQNFEFSAHDRRVVGKLWLRGCVKLLPGDFWCITTRGRRIVDNASKSDRTEPRGFEVFRSE